MKETLDVISGISAIAYSSLAEAVKGSSSGSKDNLRESRNKIKGKRVSDVNYTGDCIVIKFSDSEQMAFITIGDNRVNCNISTDKNYLRADRYSSFPESVNLRFGSDFTEEWNWEKVLLSLIGEYIALVPSDQYLFLYVKDGSDYMFDFLVDKNCKYNPFLYLSLE